MELGDGIMRVLIAEDEMELAEALKFLLEKNRFSVDVVHDGEEALERFQGTAYDVIVLDIMMPKVDGMEALARIRGSGSAVPVLMLTARAGIEDRVAGLEAGADDYLPKPFDNREFIARVRALTRRGGEYTPKVLTAGNISLDCSTFELKCGSACIRLGNKEFQMLELLMRKTGRLISTEQFMEHIWGYDSEAEINVVWAYISYLRRKLEAVGANVRISARRGQGYLLEETI